MDIYGTHFPILAAAVVRTTGPILEMGSGDFSTPLLHYACAGRLLITADTDSAWLDKYAPGYACPGAHEFQHVKSVGDDATPLVTRLIEGWRRWSTIESIGKWGVAFADCAPGEARHELAIRLAHRAHFVVCHDSEKDYEAGGNYMYDKLTEHFKYITEFRRFRPYTLICSNVEPFGIEKCDRTWSPA